MRYCLVFFALPLLIIACKEDDNNGSLIGNRYDLILGFVVPDEDRSGPTEIFVGRLNPFNPDVYDPEGISDVFLEEQLFKYASVYLAEVTFYDDAEVFITSKDQLVQLQHTGFGIYRDVKNELNIKQLNEYSLTVIRPGDIIYTDEVTVPESIEIININDKDTVTAYPRPTSPNSTDICVAYFPVKLNSPQAAYLFQSKQSNDGPSTLEYAKYVHFGDSGAPAIFEFGGPGGFVTFQWEVIALDTSATNAYNPFGTIGLKIEEAEFLDFTRDPANIEKRSSISVNANRRVIGNFGAYTSSSIEFTVKANMDSCSSGD